MIERQWFHELHGLHDDAHHQHHDPMHLCVPLVFRSDYDSLEEQLETQQRITQKWYDEAHEQRLRANRSEVVVAAARLLSADGFGNLNQRNFYRLREVLANLDSNPR